MSWTNTAARVMTVLACSGLAAAAAGCGGAATATSPRQQAAARFLAKYARPDGRVVRPDLGGDTVSEGQAYGMLLAEVAGDDAAFRRIWGWAPAEAARQALGSALCVVRRLAGRLLSRTNNGSGTPASDHAALLCRGGTRRRG